MRLACLPVFVLLLAATPPAFGWGREGHRLIAQIANHHLNAKARAEVARLLGAESLESIAPWADEVRPQRRETSTWHYINIPLAAPRGDWKKYCPDTGCVVEIIPKMQAKLRDRSLPDAERADALKFLVHFVGDMHQPLHVGDNGDRGGNDVKAVFFDRPTNLHSVWDTPILDLAEKRQPQLKARLGRPAGFWERRRLRKGTLEDWAWAARDISRDTAYGKLPAARPAVLGEEYYAAVLPSIEGQIRRGGVRLAQVLNETLGK
jgi:hypothetical protein